MFCHITERSKIEIADATVDATADVTADITVVATASTEIDMFLNANNSLDQLKFINNEVKTSLIL